MYVEMSEKCLSIVISSNFSNTFFSSVISSGGRIGDCYCKPCLKGLKYLTSLLQLGSMLFYKRCDGKFR